MAYEYTLEEAFPEVAVEFQPVTNKVLVQLRQPRQQSSGGIFFVPGTQEGVQQTTVIAKLLAVGPNAFKGPGKGREWNENLNDERPKPGDFVVIRRWAGINYMVEPVNYKPLPGDKLPNGGKVMLGIIDDVEVIGRGVVDPVNAQMHGVPVAM